VQMAASIGHGIENRILTLSSWLVDKGEGEGEGVLGRKRSELFQLRCAGVGGGFDPCQQRRRLQGRSRQENHNSALCSQRKGPKGSLCSSLTEERKSQMKILWGSVRFWYSPI